MKERNLLMLLNVIHKNGNIQRLIREKLTFKQITDITEKAIQREFIVYVEDRISLSPKGLQFLLKNQDDIKNKQKKNWIEKERKSQIARINVNDIFLPSRNSLNF